MNPQANVLRRSRQILLLLGALFFLPFIAAWVIYHFFPDWRPTGSTNYGELIAPARPLPALVLRDGEGRPLAEALNGRWTLVYLGGASCDAACVERLVLERQVRLALGKDLSRLLRIYIAPDAAAQAAAAALLAKDHPGLQILADGGADGQRAAAFFAPKDPLALYLVDPNGNWLMVYRDQADQDALQRGLLKDLKKLLRLSSIG
ncbi:MAG: cytochrome c oxidase subunit I [Nevskia sp.]